MKLGAVVLVTAAWLHLSQEAFVFGEQASSVLYGHVEGPPGELHEGNRELKPGEAERLGSRGRRGDGAWERGRSRLVVDRVQVPLERVGFPPARPPLVGEQVEADVRIRAVVGEGDQVPEEGETVSHGAESKQRRSKQRRSKQRRVNNGGVNNPHLQE